MSKIPTRKRPCRICRRWFLPNPRLKERQMTCGRPKCQREWHKKKCAEWNQKTPIILKPIIFRKRSITLHNAGAIQERSNLKSILLRYWQAGWRQKCRLSMLKRWSAFNWLSFMSIWPNYSIDDGKKQSICITLSMSGRPVDYPKNRFQEVIRPWPITIIKHLHPLLPFCF